MVQLIKPNVKMGKPVFGIGVENPQTDENIGTLIRSAKQFGASFVFTIEKKYKKQPSDVSLSSKIPIFYFKDLETFKESIPPSLIVGVEMTNLSTPLKKYKFPKNKKINTIFLLGSENNGLSQEALRYCNEIINIEGNYSLNVSVAGSIILYEYYCWRNKE